MRPNGIEMICDITTIIVNYKTPDLLRGCVESFRVHYAHAPLLLIDNGSADESTVYIHRSAAASAYTQCLLNPRNLFHGIAMDQGIRYCTTPYVFLLDSDCLILKTGFLEQMRQISERHGAYAVGRLQYKNRFGYDIHAGMSGVIPYVDPHAALLRKSSYLTLPPFVHHGAPCLQNMKKAQQRKFQLADFPIHQFVEHLGRGTCARYGYGLGWWVGIMGWLYQTANRGN